MKELSLLVFLIVPAAAFAWNTTTYSYGNNSMTTGFVNGAPVNLNTYRFGNSETTTGYIGDTYINRNRYDLGSTTSENGWTSEPFGGSQYDLFESDWGR